MRFASLASGSRGNALLVEHGSTLVMIDCGISVKAVERRLHALGREPSDLTAVLVTHEHSDHVRGVAAFAGRHNVTVWSTAGTIAAASLASVSKLEILGGGRPLDLGELTVEPFTVPHDAREPCQFAFAAGGRRLGVLTDTGHVTAHVRECLAGCDAVGLEFNHELDALWSGSYPEAVKQRIASPLGHLHNGQAAGLLRGLDACALQWVMALHVSEANNTSALVADALRSGLGERHAATTHHALQDEPSAWLEIV